METQTYTPAPVTIQVTQTPPQETVIQTSELPASTVLQTLTLAPQTTTEVSTVTSTPSITQGPIIRPSGLVLPCSEAALMTASNNTYVPYCNAWLYGFSQTYIQATSINSMTNVNDCATRCASSSCLVYNWYSYTNGLGSWTSYCQLGFTSITEVNSWTSQGGTITGYSLYTGNATLQSWPTLVSVTSTSTYISTITSTSTSTLQPISVSGGLVPTCGSVAPITIITTQVARAIAPATSRTLVPFCKAILYGYGTTAGTTVSNAALCASKATPPYIAAQWYSVTYAPTSTQSWCSIFSTVYQEQWYSGWSMYTAFTAVGTPAVSVT